MLLGQGHRTIWQFAPRLEGEETKGGGGGEKGDDKAALTRMGEQRDAARRELEAANTQLTTLQDEIKKLQNAERQRNEAEATQKGEFEKLAQTRENERDKALADLAAAREEVKALSERNTALSEAANNVVKGEFEAFPEEVRDFYTGEADDPIAMLAFIPKGKKLLEKYGGENNGEQNSREIKGAKPDPKPGNDGSNVPVNDTDKAARETFARQYQ